MDLKSKILVFVIILSLPLFSGIIIFFDNTGTTTTTSTTSTTTTTTTSTTATTITSETRNTTSTTTTSTTTTTTEPPCGEDLGEPCKTEKGLFCKRGYTINSKGLCAPVKCSRGIKSGMDGCCSQALYWCMGN